MSTSMRDFTDIMKRILSHENVIGLIILNQEGLLLKSTMENDETLQYVTHINGLTESMVRGIKQLDPQNEVVVLRINTKTTEIMIVPEPDYKLIVVKKQTNPLLRPVKRLKKLMPLSILI